MDHFLFKIDKERTGEFLSVTREIFLFVFVIFCLLHAPCKDKLSSTSLLTSQRANGPTYVFFVSVKERKNMDKTIGRY